MTLLHEQLVLFEFIMSYENINESMIKTHVFLCGTKMEYFLFIVVGRWRPKGA